MNPLVNANRQKQTQPIPRITIPLDIASSISQVGGCYTPNTWVDPIIGNITTSVVTNRQPQYATMLESLYRAIETQYLQGTGGSAVFAGVPAASGAFVHVSTSPQARNVWSVRKVHADLPEKLLVIRRYFSLATAELARVLDVHRQTIYDWMDRKYDPQATNYHRIESIYRMATEWRDLAHAPLRRALHLPISSIGERTFYEELSLNPIDEQSLRQAFGSLREILERQSRAGKTREILKEHGFRATTTARRRRRITEESHSFTAEE